ncbi:hypothetical protein [Streptomyces cavernae]|uniref:hypothetical protein n=1 Tax=Streptomyces cavernae TaxID=2259034 RepID=UPI000FEB790A|nr:hypothetical protein [Streptomyces cavernae]
MSVSEDLTSVQRCLEDLFRSVARLEQQVGGSLEMRRVRHDANHLRESVALLREAAQGHTVPKRPDLVTIPDDPYDQSLWRDSDDEGLGASDRHAP